MNTSDDNRRVIGMSKKYYGFCLETKCFLKVFKIQRQTFQKNVLKKENSIFFIRNVFCS